MTTTRSATAPRHTPEPFWQRIRTITLYPVRGGALYTLFALTFCSLLAMLPVFGWVIGLLTWLAAYKYSFEILRATADGRMDAPEGALSFDNGIVVRLVALQVLYGIVALTTLALAGPVIGIASLLVIALMQPGCIISLAIDGSLARALNPAVSLAVISRVGWPYLAVCALLFVIQASAATAGYWLSHVMPPVIGDLTLAFVSYWGLFATFHLMGYLVYQFHADLGYTPETQQSGGPDLHRPDAALLDDAETLVREGNTALAIARLGDAARTRALGLEAHELYHRLLLQSGDAATFAAHAAQYLNLLMLEGQERKALALLRSVLERDAGFVPLQTAHVALLSDRARQSGQSQLAAGLLAAALNGAPRDADASRWGLDLGLLLVDRTGREPEARLVLETARQRCEEPALRQRIDAAMRLLQPLPA